MSNARTLASTINSSSQIVVPSGGIAFTDATNPNTVANQSNLIDQDGYEQGTWTPAFSGATFSPIDAYGVYVKVGNLVTVHAYIETTYTTPYGSFHIDNLPFTVFDHPARSGSDPVNCQYGVTFTNYVTLECINASTKAYIEDNKSGANRSDMDSSNFSSPFAVRFSATYRSST